VAGGRGGRDGAASFRLPGDDLQPLKARILLMLALAVTSDPGEVRRILSEY
jgi:L-asparaginase/Glu-tRNA(Gln) amidotransferase subunit D